MTQEEKDLLLKDLCARLPYGVVVVDVNENNEIISTAYTLYNFDIRFPFPKDCSGIKPYLRPMSSMTEEEKEEYSKVIESLLWTNELDFFNKYHFDYRGLIPMGLALEAPTDMYNTKTK